MGKNNDIAPFAYDFNQFVSALRKPLIIPGQGLPNQLIFNVPEYSRVPPDSTDKVAVAIERQRLMKRQRLEELHSGSSGMYLGLETRWGKGYYVGKASVYDGHVLVVGTNGSGKSAIIANSTLETWCDPFVALDIKGELSRKYQFLQGEGRAVRPCKVFAPLNGEVHYDPYALLKQDDPLFSQYVREIANAIIPLPLDVREPYWIEMARNLLSGAIVHCFCNRMDFPQTMVYIQTSSTAQLCRQIKSSSNILARMFVSEILDLKPEHQAAIGTEMKRHTMVFATDSLIQEALSDDGHSETFSWDCLMDAEAPNIFLQLSQDRLEQWSGMIRLMLTQLIRQLERRPDKHSDKECAQPLLVLLDEFPMLGKMEIITGGLTTLRSKNVTFCLILQSIAQLDAVYGSDVRRIIVDNCQYKAILNVTEPDSQEYFSKLFGTVPVGKRSASMNVPSSMKMSFGYAIQEFREPLVFPEQFALNPNVLLHTPYGCCSAIKLPVDITHKHACDFANVMQRYMTSIHDMGGI